MSEVEYCLVAENYHRGKKVATYIIAHLPTNVEGKIIALEINQFCEAKKIPRVCIRLDVLYDVFDKETYVTTARQINTHALKTRWEFTLVMVTLSDD
jgi:hypothetical protein